MSGWTQFVLDAVLIGVGATAVMDLWGLLLRRLFAVPSLDFAMVGRWLGHLPRGRFRHAAIGQSAAVAGERALGWSAHYVTGWSSPRCCWRSQVMIGRARRLFCRHCCSAY